MAIAQTPYQNRVYVLREDRDLPAEEQTEFLIRTLTANEYATLSDGSITADGTGETLRAMTGTTARKALLFGLVGWRNFRTADGRDVEFRSTMKKVGGIDVAQCDPANLDRLRESWRREIANAITDGEQPTEEDLGN